MINHPVIKTPCIHTFIGLFSSSLDVSSFSVLLFVLRSLVTMEKNTNNSTFEVLEPLSPRHKDDGSFQTQVLTILHNLKEDFHSMGDRVAKLENYQAHSALPDETQSVLGSLSMSQDDVKTDVQSKPWVDVDLSERPDFSFVPRWDKEDHRSTGVKLLKTSVKKEAFLIHVRHPQPATQTMEGEDWGP